MELQIFENPEFGKVRTVEINGKGWLVGKDVAEALGYSNTSKAVINHVDEEDKQIIQSSQNGNFEIPNRGLTIINESGFYSLVLSSKLPTAKNFKHWVTSEVLPSIRKHGAYMTEQTLEQALTSPDFLIKLATELKNEKESRLKAEKQIELDKPKVIFADAVSASTTSILVGELAKIIKQNGHEIGQNRLFKWLRENGYLFKDRNEPTKKAMDLKLFEVVERTINNPDGSIRITRTTKVTGKGQQYFVNKFLKMKTA